MTKPTAAANLNTDDIEALVQLALGHAKKAGAEQAEVAASQDIGLSATARLGDIEHLEYTNDRGIGITVYRGSRKGSASTSDFSPSAISEAVSKACSFADFTAADEYAGLADADRMCTEMLDLDLDHPWSLETDHAIQMAIDCEAAGIKSDSRINNSEGATVASGRGVRAYGNSHGFTGSYARTSHTVSCVLLAEQDGHMERDYYYTTARDADDLDSVTSVGEEAARRTLGRLGAQKIGTQRVPVIFVPELARGFLGHAMGAILGGAQYRRASFLLDAVGETLFPEFVSIGERPHIPKAVASRAWDSEGVATYDRDIVADGVLKEYILSSYSARRLGLQTTANAGGMQNLVVSSNASGLDELIESMGTGLLVEELIGQGVNAVTGDYSRGAVGHWVEGGKIAYPVHEITIAGNLRDLYQRIRLIGADQDTRGAIRCGSLLVDEMTIAGA